MKCLACHNSNILEVIENKKYAFKLFPCSSSIQCSWCRTKHDVLFLLATPRRINSVITKRCPIALS